MMKPKGLLPAILVALWSTGWGTGVASGQELGIYGYTKWFAHPNLNAPYHFDRLGTRLQLNFSKQAGERLSFFSALDFNFEDSQETGLAEERRSAAMQVYPVETYIDYYSSRMDVRVGKQFIFWGTTDWINPTDNINPWDYKNISAEIEDYRIPVNAAKLDLYLGESRLEGVAVFHFLPNKVPLRFPEKMGGLPVEVRPAQLPESKVSNIELGMRFSSQIGLLDYSLSYFHGFAKFPSVIFQPIFHNYLPGPVGIAVLPRYDRIQVFGADFVTTRGKFALKGEGAYFRTKDAAGNDPFIENPHVQYVLGIDYYPRNELALNFQFVQLVRLRYSAAEERESWKRLGMPEEQIRVPEKEEKSVSARIQFQPFDFGSVQLIGVVNLRDRDFFLLPIFNYQIADGVDVYCGATLFRGPADSPFGRNKSYSRAFVEVKYSFAY